MKGLYWTILVILTAAAIVVGCMIHFSSGKSETTEFDESYGTDVKTLDIEAALMDVIITEGSEFRIKYDGAKEFMPECNFSSGSGKLTVKQKTNIKPNKGMNYESKLTIEIPKDHELESFELELSMGNVEGNTLRSKRTKISDNLGNITFKTVSSGEIDIEANLGDVTLDKCSADEIDITASLGNVRVGIDGDVSDYSVEAEASLGTIEIGGVKYEKSFEQKGGSKKIEIECSLGNVEVG